MLYIYSGIQSITAVRDLAVYIDADVTILKPHVVTVVRSCFAALNQIRSVSRVAAFLDIMGLADAGSVARD